MKQIFNLLTRIKSDLDKIESYFTGRNEAANHLGQTEDNAAFNLRFDKGWVILEDNYDVDRIIDKIEEMGVIETGKVERKEDETNLPKLKEGSITKRKDGRWHGKYYDNGIRKNVYAKTKKELIKKMNIAILDRNKRDESSIANKKTTLNKWVVTWFETYKKPKLKPSSVADYEHHLINKVNNYKLICKKQISKITALDLERFFQTIDAPNTKARTFRQLKTCMTAAYKYKIISENPFDFVDYIAEPKASKTVPSYEELNKLMNYAKKTTLPYYWLIKFLSLTGLRKGEALALKWSDIKDGRIHITKAYDSRSKKIQTPKTKASIRKVPLFPEAKLLLEIIPKKDEFIFGKLSSEAVTKRIRIYNKRIGTNITLHSLRHYFATECLEAGISKKLVQNWLGHAKYEVTINTYTHVNSEFENKEIDKMAKYRDKNNKK
jgi:integrase